MVKARFESNIKLGVEESVSKESSMRDLVMWRTFVLEPSGFSLSISWICETTAMR